MGVSEIIESVDREIAILQQVRELLGGAPAPKKKPGRPRKAATVVTVAAPKVAAKPAKKKRNLSPEGRKRIAEAVRRRWAAQKKGASAFAK